MAPPKTTANRQVLGEVADKANWSAIQQTEPEAGKKRKSNEATESSIDPDDFDCEGMFIDQNCDQVRRKIRRYLDSGAMKIGEFCKAIDVSNKSLNDFLRQSGKMKGAGSATYQQAWEFFKKREMAGIKIPNKKQKTDAGSSGNANAATSNIKKAGNSAGIDISTIHLPGEESDDVPVHDSCDEIRRKINAHLKKPGVTQAQFCRDMYAQLRSANAPSMIQSSQLTRFRGNKGANNGCTSSVYYGAYVFFEKERIKEGKQKTKHRQEMERIWPSGADRETDGRHGYWCKGSERPHEDEYGQVFFY